MRRTAAMLAVVLGLVLVGGLAEAKQSLKVDTRVAIDAFDYDVHSDTVTFFGHLRARKASCLRRRTVRLEQITIDERVGSAKSRRSGDWEIDFIGVDVATDEFQATVGKRKIVKKRRVIRCRRDVSSVVCTASNSVDFVPCGGQTAASYTIPQFSKSRD
jgi:hypothetical protein